MVPPYDRWNRNNGWFKSLGLNRRRTVEFSPHFLMQLNLGLNPIRQATLHHFLESCQEKLDDKAHGRQESVGDFALSAG
jgi:hypothetical protein